MPSSLCGRSESWPLRVWRELNRRQFAFMGAIHDPEPLIEETAPEVAAKLADDEVDAALLTPS